MGYDRKYGRVITEHGDIPDDEPVIVFRARDKTVPHLLAYYLMLCTSAGSPQRHLEIIRNTHRLFTEWQDQYETKVRVPDSERSREWMGE